MRTPLVLLCLLAAVAFAPATASAHTCVDGASCDASDCPEDGDVHVHVDLLQRCVSMPPLCCRVLP